MQIFVGEYVCGGGLADQNLTDIPQSIRDEGAAMLRAIVSDLSDVATTVVPLPNQERLIVALTRQ